MTSHQLTGGSGFVYEANVVAYYLSKLLFHGTAAGLTSFIVQRVAQQQSSAGEPLDDLIVDAIRLSDQLKMRLSLQVKKRLTISGASSNKYFREIIQNSWKTLQQEAFRKDTDKVGAVIYKISNKSLHEFQYLCEVARSQQNSQSFCGLNNAFSNSHHEILKAIRQIIQDPFEDAVYLLLRHFILIQLDLSSEGSTDKANIINDLARGLISSQAERANTLWCTLFQLAQEGATKAAEFTRESLVNQLQGDFQFKGSPHLTDALKKLKKEVEWWIKDHSTGIRGEHIDRTDLLEELKTKIHKHRLTLIRGLPGTGKTVLLKDLVTKYTDQGPTLLLAAGRISGCSWGQYAHSIGLSDTTIEPLLTEIVATGFSILFVDGLDMMSEKELQVTKDLLHSIADPRFRKWHIVATVRDNGIELLKNWMPQLFFDDVEYCETKFFTQQETEALAKKIPELKSLLMNPCKDVCDLVRRPFFTAILAKKQNVTQYIIESELDFMEIWWTDAGQYNLTTCQENSSNRQRALIDLAKLSVSNLGKNIHLSDLSTDPNTIASLKKDDVLQEKEPGHTLEFTHDIFFEWSFCHVLIDKRDNWIDCLIEANEPPALARPVELFSQYIYSKDIEKWKKNLLELDKSTVRSQWFRVWLLAPIFSHAFGKAVSKYTAILFADNGRLLSKLLVWIQAEKTIPHPPLLSGQLNSNLSVADRANLAYSLVFPSDPISWYRLLNYLLSILCKISRENLSTVTQLFMIWQTAFRFKKNLVSEQIIKQCKSWLDAIERYKQLPLREKHPTRSDPKIRKLVDLELQLHNLVLEAAFCYPKIVSNYLKRIKRAKDLRSKIVEGVMNSSFLLSKTHPKLLADITRKFLLDELPDEKVKRLEREMRVQKNSFIFSSDEFSSSDWETLSICDQKNYFQQSSLREYFHSLLANREKIGLLLIRDLLNHATKAWQQLHQHIPNSQTPLPLSLQFPWGRQEFWGDDAQYRWFRICTGPNVIGVALMALEQWALQQQDAGKPTAKILKQLLEGHWSISVLGIAIHLVLRGAEVSDATLPLVTSQRLWRLDILRYKEDSIHEGFAKLDALESRRLELRSLVPLFLSSKNKKLKNACSLAIKAFPEKLEFAYKEQANNEKYVAELQKTAQIWSGYEKHKSSTQFSDECHKLPVNSQNPQQAKSKEEEAPSNPLDDLVGLDLLPWLEECFKSKSWSQTFSLDEAVKKAKSVFEIITKKDIHSSLALIGHKHGVIAGVAAAVYCFAPSNKHKEWVDTMLQKYLEISEEFLDFGITFPTSRIPWHPKRFVAHALGARIRQNDASLNDRFNLYGLAIHPLKAVSWIAFGEIASCWEQDQRFAWCGFNLGFRLAKLPRQYPKGELEDKYRKEALLETWQEYTVSGDFPPFIQPIPFWVEASKDQWDLSSEKWHSDFAAEVLNKVPVAKVMNSKARDKYLDALEGFLNWTIDVFNVLPQNENDSHRSYKKLLIDLMKWQYRFGESLAKAAPYLSAKIIQERFLALIFKQPDEIAMPFLNSLATNLIASEILDAQAIKSDTLKVLQAILDRILQHVTFGNHCQEISGFDLPPLIQAFFFVNVERADKATRFANGIWDDLPKVMPLINKMICQIGWVSYVVEQYLILCKRVKEHYPVEDFLDQIWVQMPKGNLPDTWKEKTIPASISELIQQYLEKRLILKKELVDKVLRILDALIDMGDSRSASLQSGQLLRDIYQKGL